MRSSVRSRAARVVVAAAIAVATLAATAPSASAEGPVAVSRVAGADRYETAADAARDAFPTGTSTVVLASGLDFPDALAGNGLAGASDAALLLTAPNTLPDATEDALDDLGATTVIVLGGEAAIGASVVARLESLGYSVERVAGADRFATAAEVAERIGVPVVNGERTVVVASALTAADSLAISPGTYALELPLLLTGPDTLAVVTEAFLDNNDVDRVLLMGGPGAISDAVRTQIQSLGIEVTRIAGADRFATSIAAANYLIGFDQFSLVQVFLANGVGFADALAGGQLAALRGGPILLVPPTESPSSVITFLFANRVEYEILTVFGGPGAIASDVVTDAANAGDTSPPGPPGPSGTSATTLPELIQARIVRTVLAGGVDPKGTTVEFTFDENIDLFQPDFTKFEVWSRNTGTATSGNAVVSKTGNRTQIRFDSIDTVAKANEIILGTAAETSVRDDDGRGNPVGQANIGSGTSGTTTPLPAGITVAPDLQSASGFRTATAPASTTVDFRFDQAASATANTGGYHLVLTNGTVIDCTGPTNGSATASGGPTAGGDDTTIHTAVCPDDGVLGPASSSTVARAYVDALTVKGTDAAAADNVAQAVQIGNGGTTATPDLDSASFAPNATVGPTPVDAVLLTFDEDVTGALVDASFVLYDNDGSTDATGSASLNAINSQQVRVDFADGALANAVGVQVLAGAVTSDDTGTPGEFDEFGVANSTSSSGVAAGDVPQRPQLTSVEIVTINDVFGNPVDYDVRYLFDEDVTAPTDGDFQLLRSDGTVMACSAGAVTTGKPVGQNNVFTCTAYGPATVAQIGAGALGVVASAGAVDADDDGAAVIPGSRVASGGT